MIPSQHDKAASHIFVRGRFFSVFLGSRRWDSNPRPAVYETAALPLSYAGEGVANNVG